MTERPIPFTGPMVRAIIDGRKTMTRRVVKPGKDRCQYGEPGNHLWVKETFSICNHGDVYYKADMPLDLNCGGDVIKWKSLRFMPRRLSRITLEIVFIWPERLLNITIRDAIKEGGETYAEFLSLWDGINEKRGYAAHLNPLVWVIEFKRIK